MLQGEKIPSRVLMRVMEITSLFDAGRNGMPRVVERWGIAVVWKVLAGWLAANENARQPAAVSARS